MRVLETHVQLIWIVRVTTKESRSTAGPIASVAVTAPHVKRMMARRKAYHIIAYLVSLWVSDRVQEWALTLVRPLLS